MTIQCIFVIRLFIAYVFLRDSFYTLQFLIVCFYFLSNSVNLREELVKECLKKGTELVQAIADTLFNLPSTEDVDGPLVKLPPPTTRLPREKPVSCASIFMLSYIFNL